LAEPGLFVEAIVAPSFSTEAIEILTTRPKWRNNVRLIEVGDVGQPVAAMITVGSLDGMGIGQGDSVALSVKATAARAVTAAKQ